MPVIPGINQPSKANKLSCITGCRSTTLDSICLSTMSNVRLPSSLAAIACCLSSPVHGEADTGPSLLVS